MSDYIEGYLAGLSKGHALSKKDLESVKNDLLLTQVRSKNIQDHLEELIEWGTEADELMAKSQKAIRDVMPLVKAAPKTADGMAMYPGLVVFWRPDFEVISIEVNTWTHAIDLERDGDVFSIYEKAEERLSS